MKYTKTSIIRSVLTTELLLPILSIGVFTLSGIFVNHNKLYFLCNILLLLFFFASLTKVHRKTVNFFLIFFLVLTFNLYFYINNNGAGTGIIEFFRTFTGYYFLIFLGYVLYKYYYQTGKEMLLLNMLVYFALFISCINVCHFLLIQTDAYSLVGFKITFNRYDIVIRYLNILNKTYTDYIVFGLKYDGLLRPVGYFFDTHSQYYTPLGALIILAFKDIDIKYKKTIIAFLLASILITGIKTAYVTIVLLGLIFLIININNKLIIRYVGTTFLLMIVLSVIFSDYLIAIFFGEQLWKIFPQLLDHFIQIPMKLWKYDKLSFLFGGVPLLRDEDLFYSEVFLVTVSFYIGFIGLLMYFSPIILLKNIKSDKLPAFLYLSFLLSLSHYSVFFVGINNLLSAMPFMYFFAMLGQKKSPESKLHTPDTLLIKELPLL